MRRLFVMAVLTLALAGLSSCKPPKGVIPWCEWDELGYEVEMLSSETSQLVLTFEGIVCK